MNKTEFFALQKRADEAQRARKHLESVERLIRYLVRNTKDEPATAFRFYVSQRRAGSYSHGVDMDVSLAAAKEVILPELRKELVRAKATFAALQA